MKKLTKNFRRSMLLAVGIALALVVSAHQNDLPTSKAMDCFKSHFEKAVNVAWQKFHPLHLATFSLDGESWIAYITPDGSLVTSGRRISYTRLPIIVQQELKPLIAAHEKKMGSLEAGLIYEMVKAGNTQYFICYGNENEYVTFMAEDNGVVNFVAKQRRTSSSDLYEAIIAKK